MTEDAEFQAAATDAVAKAEAAATRRRWINLGEFVAVVGLIIAAISLWLTYADRKADLADKQMQQAEAANDRARYAVKSSLRGNDVVIESDDRHTVGDITVAFPTALGVSSQTSPTQTISESWFKGALLKATDGGADKQAGKLPVLLTVNYLDGDTQRATTGVFDIVWQTQGGGLLGGRSLKIVGMRLRERGGTQKRLDSLWTVKPAG